MNYVDSPGLYRGEIESHSLGETRNGYPQFVARFRAIEKYVDDLHELRHFHEQGVVEQKDDGTFDPQWVDWAEFDEHTTGYFVLFNDPETFDDTSKLLNYDQLQTATGWEGDEFDSLNDGTFVGKQVQFRVDETEYKGEVQYKVNWIDAYDANPTRELQSLDEDKVKSLNSKLKMGGGKKSSKPSKPSKPSQGKSGETSKTEKSKDQSSANSNESSSESSSQPPKKSPPKTSKQSDSGTAEQSESDSETTNEQTEGSESESLPAEITQDQAWEFVCNNKGENDDTDIEDAWIAACNEVGEDKDEDDFTQAEWARVRDIVIRDLALNVS